MSSMVAPNNNNGAESALPLQRSDQLTTDEIVANLRRPFKKRIRLTPREPVATTNLDETGVATTVPCSNAPFNEQLRLPYQATVDPNSGIERIFIVPLIQIIEANQEIKASERQEESSNQDATTADHNLPEEQHNRIASINKRAAPLHEVSGPIQKASDKNAKELDTGEAVATLVPVTSATTSQTSIEMQYENVIGHSPEISLGLTRAEVKYNINDEKNELHTLIPSNKLPHKKRVELKFKLSEVTVDPIKTVFDRALMPPVSLESTSPSFKIPLNRALLPPLPVKPPGAEHKSEPITECQPGTKLTPPKLEEPTTTTLLTKQVKLTPEVPVGQTNTISKQKVNTAMNNQAQLYTQSPVSSNIESPTSIRVPLKKRKGLTTPDSDGISKAVTKPNTNVDSNILTSLSTQAIVCIPRLRNIDIERWISHRPNQSTRGTKQTRTKTQEQKGA